MSDEPHTNVELRKDDEFRDLIPRAVDSEKAELERSILSEGCRDPLVAWRPPGEQAEPPVIVDGYTRYDICDKHGVPYRVIERNFSSREEVEAWVIVTHLGRRNLTAVGRCEAAIRLERMLEPLARERMSEGGRKGGLGRGSPGANASEAGAEGAGKPVPELVQAIARLHPSAAKSGRARIQAAKATGVGAETLRKYKKVRTAAAADDENPELAKAARKLLRKMRGTTPTMSIDRAHNQLKAVEERQERARDLRVRAEAAERELGGSDASDENSADARDDRAEAAGGPGKRQAADGEAPASGGWHVLFPPWHHSLFQDLIGTLPEKKVKLVLTDPPYGQDLGGIEGDEDPEVAAGLLREMLEGVRPALAEHAHIVFFCSARHEPRMRRVLQEELTYRLEERSYLVWVKTDEEGRPKTGAGDAARTFGPSHERAIHAVVGDPSLYPRPTDTFFEPRVPERLYGHRTTKPVSMLAQIIRATTAEGELVVDPFGGSASMLEAAMRCGRRSWGTERQHDFYVGGQARLGDVRGELRAAPAEAEPRLFEMVLRRAREPEPARVDGAREVAARRVPASLDLGIPGTMWGWGDAPEDARLAAEAEVFDDEHPDFSEGEALEDFED